MKKLLLLSILGTVLLASELYFMPFEAKNAQKRLLFWIDTAKNSIDIAMYSFTNKTIAKRLKNAAKRGVKIHIVADFEQSMRDRHSKIGYLAKYKNINVRLTRGKYVKRGKYYGKMHMKLAIFDNKKIILGSANWSHSAFGNNYETIYFIKDYAQAKKAKKFFSSLFSQALPY